MKNTRSGDLKPHTPPTLKNNDGVIAGQYFKGGLVYSFLLGLFCCAISDTSAQTRIAFEIAKVLSFVVAASIFLQPRLWSLCTLMTLLISARGIDGLLGDDSYTTASIWVTSLGPITPSITVFGLIVTQILRYQLTKPPQSVAIALLAFLAIPIMTGYAFGNYANESAISYAKTDLRLSALLCSGLYLMHLLLEQQAYSHPTLIGTLFGSLSARHLCDFVDSFSAEGISFGHGNIVSVCPAKSCVLALFLFSLILLVLRHNTAIGILGTTTTAYLITAYNSRGLYVTSFISIAYLVFILPSNQRFRAITLAIGFGVAGVSALFCFRPDTAFSASYRASTLLFGSAASTTSMSSSSGLAAVCPVREAQFRNIISQAVQNWSLPLGTGFGGWYTDTVARIGVDVDSAFPSDQLMSGRFFYAHDLPTHFILKYGVFGLLSFIGLWLLALPPRRLLASQLKKDLKGPTRLYTCGVLSILAFTPTAIQSLWWSGKGIVMTSLIVSLLAGYRRRLLLPGRGTEHSGEENPDCRKAGGRV